MHLKIFPLLLVACFRTALITALPQQTFNSGQNSQDIYAPYRNIPQDKWPRYKGQLVDPTCILTNLGKEHRKREWPVIPQPAYPSSGYCPAWQQNTETKTDSEDRDLCGDGFEPRCCVGNAFGFGLGTVNTPCYQCTPETHFQLYSFRPSGASELSKPSSQLTAHVSYAKRFRHDCSTLQKSVQGPNLLL